MIDTGTTSKERLYFSLYFSFLSIKCWILLFLDLLKGEEYLKALDCFEAFVRTIGPMFKTSTDVDIVQLALGQPADSVVHRKAVDLANERPERLYFNLLNPGVASEYHMATITHHGAVEDGCFLSDYTKILTTNGDGQIKVWNVESGDVCHRFTGHRAKILCLAQSPDGDQCASGSEDGAIKIWNLSNILDDTLVDFERLNVSSSKYQSCTRV